MPKCLRCGAGGEWIQGNVKDEPGDEALAALRAAVRAADDEIADWRAWSERLGPAVETPMVVDEDDYDTARAAAEPYMKEEET